MKYLKGKKRGMLSVLVLLMLGGMAEGLEIYVAPLLYIDESGGMSKEKEQVRADILEELGRQDTGLELEFLSAGERGMEPPQSLNDVITVCRNERIEHLLYGYVTRKNYTVTAELRLFDYEARRIEKVFYSMDDTEHYGRVIKDVCLKLLDYLRDSYGLGIKEERVGAAQLQIPIGLGYWTALGTEWVSVLLGTFSIEGGLRFIPDEELWVIYGKGMYGSLGLRVSYRLGIGNPNAYRAYYSGIELSTPLGVHLRLAKEHELHLGVSFIYYIELLSIEKKYEGYSHEVYNNIGLGLELGYQFNLNERWSFYVDNRIEIECSGNVLVTYSPVIGCTVRVYRKEMERKW